MQSRTVIHSVTFVQVASYLATAGMYTPKVVVVEYVGETYIKIL